MSDNILSICLDIEPSSFLQELALELTLSSSSSLTDIISLKVGEQYQNYLDNLVKQQLILRYVFKNSYGRYSKPISLYKIMEKDWLDIYTNDITVVAPKGKPTIEFIHPNNLVWGKNTRIDELNAQVEELWETHGIRLGCQYSTSHPQVIYKSLKTIDKYRIKMDNIGLPTKILSPFLQRYNTPCNCPPECLQGYIDNCWDWVVKFACRICGKTYLCECFEDAMKKFLLKAENASSGYSEEGWPNRFIQTYKQRKVRKGICHICREVPSDLTYCHEMYRNKFIVSSCCGKEIL